MSFKNSIFSFACSGLLCLPFFAMTFGYYTGCYAEQNWYLCLVFLVPWTLSPILPNSALLLTCDLLPLQIFQCTGCQMGSKMRLLLGKYISPLQCIRAGLFVLLDFTKILLKRIQLWLLAAYLLRTQAESMGFGSKEKWRNRYQIIHKHLLCPNFRVLVFLGACHNWIFSVWLNYSRRVFNQLCK